MILQCIIGLKSQSIDFTNSFARADIPSGEPVFVELPMDFKNDEGQHDVVIKLKKILYVQAQAARLLYEKLRNGLLERCFGTRKVDPCVFMTKTVMCVVYVDDCISWSCSQSDIDNVIKYFNEDGPSYIR